MNEGPMTGSGRGTCPGPTGRRGLCGGRRRREAGRGRGYRFGQACARPVEPFGSVEARIDFLERELAAAKGELKPEQD